jgi:hypothetical protein
MTELDLTAEDLACAGLRRVTDEWRLGLKLSNLDRFPVAGGKAAGDIEQAVTALAPPTPPKRRIRKTTLASQLRQVWKAAQAAGVQVTVSIEGALLTATPMSRGTVAPGDAAPQGPTTANDTCNEWDRDLGAAPPTPLRQ